MVGDLQQLKGKLNQIGYHSKLQHHAIPFGTGLLGKIYVLMQDNDPKHTCKLCQRYIKSKEEQHIHQLMPWLVQSEDLNPIDLVWDELDWKVRAKQKIWLTSGYSCWKTGLNYLQFTCSLWWKECRESLN